ncbi:MAG: hypothetical protein K8I60_21990 [Anaerolineae bacterium]|nr:hypothetical protein [Anaerolineae bacterium]
MTHKYGIRYRWALLLVALFIALAALPALAQDTTEEPVTTAEAPDTTAASVDTAVQQPVIETGLVTGIRHLHSLLRWLAVLITVAAIAKLGMGIIQGGTFDALAKRLMIAFSAAITLQWVVGIIFLLTYGSLFGFGFPHIWEHAGTMTVAVGLSHMHNRWKNAPDSTRYRASLGIVVVVLILVIIGVALLPQGWRLIPA